MKGEWETDMHELCKPVKSVEEKWKLLPHFFKLRGLLRQHIDSFNYFINTGMKDIVRAQTNYLHRSDVNPAWFFEYTRVNVGMPSVQEDSHLIEKTTPFECRLRDCTYSAPLTVSVLFKKGNKKVLKHDVQIARIPIMVRSCKCVLTNLSDEELVAKQECPYDAGGYFIIKGTEKVILMHEQLQQNRAIIELDNKGNVVANINSSTHDRKSRCSLFFKANKVYLKSSTLGDNIPVVIVLKAMGLECDQEIVQLIGSEPALMNLFAGSFEEQYTLGILTQQHALAYIGTKIRSARAKNAAGWSTNKKSGAVEDEAMDALANYVLNHVPVKNFNFRHKQIYVCHVIRRLLQTVLDRSLLDDKDYYGNKRLELAGDLYSLLFEDLFKRFNTEVKRSWDKALGKLHRENEVDVTNFMKTEVITGGFIHAISTGTWNLPRFKMDRAGVTQVLSRLSYISALGMMTRVNSNFEKTRKVAGPRSLQPSQWGMLCPADTPEGEQCGLVKNLALLAHVTSDEPVGPLYRACYDLGVEDVALLTGQEINGDDACVIFLNGLIVGVHARPVEFVHKLRYLRRRGCLGEFVSVYLNSIQRTVHIASDGGRICRPLLVIEYGRLRLTRSHMTRLERGKATMTDLIKAGIIEYVDVNEENNCFIALKEDEIVPETTHMEIDPLTVLGVVAGLIPFPHHNQSPRNTYQCAMGKQAMGTIGINQYKRFDSLLYTMVYPQKPMVKTRVLDLVNFDKVPGGQNATLAVMSFSGYDIEDAIVLNRASLDRGFGRCLVVKKHQTGLKRYSTVDVTDQVRGPPQVHEFPMREKDPRWKRYRALDHDGICCVGEKLEPGMIMVNKECPSNLIDLNERNTSEVKFKPAPLTYKGASHYGESVVDKVLITSTHNDMFLTKILLRQCRRPEVGDKFSSRHGQKGVCGAIVNQEDMPFNDLGMCPDLIMNPHGFPSRMTVGKMIELIAGKAGVLEGRQAYGTAFGEDFGNADRVEDCAKTLVQHGFSYIGKDYLTSGVSGEPLESFIFMGPVFYQKLKHMVMDKMHARARGPRAILTRQPTEGRSRDGGLRLGEMERDCLISYGAAALLMERLMFSSDAFTACVCEDCGLLGYEQWCQRCKSGEKMSNIRLPYACKLLFHELQSMNIVPCLQLRRF